MTNDIANTDQRFQAVLNRMTSEDPRTRSMMMLNADDPWMPVIYDTDARLAELDPTYKISQVKEKFGGLRYYYVTTPGLDAETRVKMDLAVMEAERRCAEIEKANRVG